MPQASAPEAVQPAPEGAAVGPEGQSITPPAPEPTPRPEDAQVIEPARITPPEPPLPDSDPVRMEPTAAEPESPAPSPNNITVEQVRQKAAVVRGWPDGDPPVVDGVKFSYSRRDNGWVFSRKHEDRVREALGGGVPSGPETAPVALQNIGAEAVPEPAAQIAAAAANADPDPTPAQAEAGNYRKGHTRWNGLDISIETARGQERRGYDDAGNVTWRSTSPADYGYIRQTEGADGDHVDVYFGPRPESDSVYVIDQIDADTRAFDEHKVMLGFPNRRQRRNLAGLRAR